MTRPLFGRRLRDAADAVPIPGAYDPARQLRVGPDGYPVVATRQYDTFTEAERDPADPSDPPEPREPRNVDTATRVARDPADPPDPPVGWTVAVETLTKTTRDPGDEMADRVSGPELALADDLATGVVAF